MVRCDLHSYAGIIRIRSEGLFSAIQTRWHPLENYLFSDCKGSGYGWNMQEKWQKHYDSHPVSMPCFTPTYPLATAVMLSSKSSDILF